MPYQIKIDTRYLNKNWKTSVNFSSPIHLKNHQHYVTQISFCKTCLSTKWLKDFCNTAGKKKILGSFITKRSCSDIHYVTHKHRMVSFRYVVNHWQAQGEVGATIVNPPRDPLFPELALQFRKTSPYISFSQDICHEQGQCLWGFRSWETKPMGRQAVTF